MFKSVFIAASLYAVEARLTALHPEMESGPDRRDSFCSNPVAKKKVDFPDSLIGRAPITFDMYSGYVNVTSEDWLYYWYFESADGNKDAPLVYLEQSIICFIC
jgi:hypothetical protein